MTNFQSGDKIDSSNAKRKTGMSVRYFLIFNSFFAFIMVYANKVVLSVAIVAMVSETTLPINQHFNHTTVNASNLNHPSFAALHSGSLNQQAFNESQKLTNSPPSNQPNSSLIAARAISSAHPIMHQHKTNQVSYDHKTKSKVLGRFQTEDLSFG